jgi:hypothetical protein
MVFGFLRTEIILPGPREEFIQVIVEVSVNQNIPLMLVEPDPVAITTAINIKLGIRKNFIPSHDMTAIGTKL